MCSNFVLIAIISNKNRIKMDWLKFAYNYLKVVYGDNYKTSQLKDFG